MGYSRYDKARYFLKRLKETYKTDELLFDVLVSEIKKQIGDDEVRTVRPYIKLMRDHGMIVQAEARDTIRVVNLDGPE